MTWVFFIFAGFLSGSVLYSYLAAKKLRHVDITAAASDHNPGGANAFIYAGKGIGVLGIVCDLLKGALPVWCAGQFLSPEELAFALVLAAPVAGHAFSIFHRGKGGKAISVSFGVLIGVLSYSYLVFVLAAAMIFFSVIVVLRPHSRRAMVSFACTAAAALLFTRPYGIKCGAVLVCAIVIYKHLHSLWEQARAEREDERRHDEI